jgi:cell division septum initiation protein DivIVA
MEVENSKLEIEVERMQATLAADKSMASTAHKALASALEHAQAWSENLGSRDVIAYPCCR